ncbi:hypothetical protein KM043_002263 [Ampulex compressa]|nr:hypothetical protein KM043_002263 [Ampulex compressa]
MARGHRALRKERNEGVTSSRTISGRSRGDDASTDVTRTNLARVCTTTIAQRPAADDRSTIVKGASSSVHQGARTWELPQRGFVAKERNEARNRSHRGDLPPARRIH